MENKKVPSAGRSRAIGNLDPHELKRWRTQVRMLSQVELANAAGLSRGEISHLETGKRQPLATTLRRLCVALECEPADLLTRNGRPAGRETRENNAATQQQEAVSA